MPFAFQYCIDVSHHVCKLRAEAIGATHRLWMARKVTLDNNDDVYDIWVFVQVLVLALITYQCLLLHYCVYFESLSINVFVIV